MNENIRKRILEHLSPEVVLRSSNSMEWSHLERVLAKANTILSRFSNRDLSKFAEDAKLLVSMIGDYAKGEYRVIPWSSIAVVAFSLLYVLVPTDFICDLVPMIGWLDDAFVMYLCLQIIGVDLEEYARWKNCQQA